MTLQSVTMEIVGKKVYFFPRYRYRFPPLFVSNRTAAVPCSALFVSNRAVQCFSLLDARRSNRRCVFMVKPLRCAVSATHSAVLWFFGTRTAPDRTRHSSGTVIARSEATWQSVLPQHSGYCRRGGSLPLPFPKTKSNHAIRFGTHPHPTRKQFLFLYIYPNQ